jgi:hypothetical protein
MQTCPHCKETLLPSFVELFCPRGCLNSNTLPIEQVNNHNHDWVAVLYNGNPVPGWHHYYLRGTGITSQQVVRPTRLFFKDQYSWFNETHLTQAEVEQWPTDTNAPPLPLYIIKALELHIKERASGTRMLLGSQIVNV